MSITDAWIEDDGDAREIVKRLAPHHTGAIKVSQRGGTVRCDECGASVGGLKGAGAGEVATVCACGTLLVARGGGDG